MGKSLFTALLAPVFIAAAITGAAAQECGPLRQILSLPATVKNSRILIPVSINGVEKNFLLDTAGAVSQIAPSFARELKLVANESDVKLMDLRGNASASMARVALTLGQLRDPRADLQIATHDFEGEEFSGIIAADYMGNYDVEIDAVGGKVNYFSPDHCAGRVVYWNAAPIAVIPFLLRDHHIRIKAKLNGREVDAILDTGAPGTLIRGPAAERLFGITADTPGNTNMLDVEGGKEFQRVFETMELEGINIGKPRLTVIPAPVASRDPNNDFVTGTRVQRVNDLESTYPAVIIGMDIIRHLRFYIAFKERKLYVTPPVARAATPAAAN